MPSRCESPERCLRVSREPIAQRPAEREAASSDPRAVAITELEFVEAENASVAVLLDAEMGFFSVFAAYVVAGRFVGKSLHQIVAIALSFTYSLFLIGPALGVYGAINRISFIRAQYFLAYPDGLAFAPGNTGLLVLALIPLVVGWVDSLLYLHAYVRRSHDAIAG